MCTEMKYNYLVCTLTQIENIQYYSLHKSYEMLWKKRKEIKLIGQDLIIMPLRQQRGNNDPYTDSSRDA